MRAGGLRSRRRTGTRPAPRLPHGARVVAARRSPGGDCVFLEHGRPRLCAVHAPARRDGAAFRLPAVPARRHAHAARRLGDAVALLPDRGASHAVSRRRRRSRVVSDPPAFPPSWPYEGLDARDALPPLLRPGVLMDWAASSAGSARGRGARPRGAPVRRRRSTPGRRRRGRAPGRRTPAPSTSSWRASSRLPLGRARRRASDLAAALERLGRQVVALVPAVPPAARARARGLRRARRAVRRRRRGRRSRGRSAAGSRRRPSRAGWRSRARACEPRSASSASRSACCGPRRRAAAPRPAARSTPSCCRRPIRRADLLLVHLADPEALARG